MLEVLGDETARTADRLQAAMWLADRGFGKALQAVEIDVPVQSWESVLARLPKEDLETMKAILEKSELWGMATRQLVPASACDTDSRENAVEARVGLEPRSGQESAAV